MGSVEILHEMLIRKGTAEAIYQALTEQSGLASWFTPTTTAEPKPGSIAEFHFDRQDRPIRVEITQLEPYRKVQWKVLQGLSGWEGETGVMTWQLTAMEWGVLVRLSHSGWSTTEGPFASVSYKLACYMTSLKKYIETGTGTYGA
jgi:uncharacterized protein YndB with AHSA1/START domain